MFYQSQVPFDGSAQVDHRKRLALIGVGLAAAVFVIVVVALHYFSAAPATFAVQSTNQNDASQLTESVPAASTVVVHVLGCVSNPGVYELPDGSRISDAVDRAGGMTQEASQEAVNLAEKVVDGQQIVILSRGDYEQVQAQAPGSQQGGSAAVSVAGVDSAGRVNINTASSDQLQTLSGIGQATAQKIIAYREKNGKFSSVDDLVNVSGIGEKRLATLRDFITV